MLSFWRNKVCPIGIDLGGHSLKIVQLAQSENGLDLIAAGLTQVPPEIRDDGEELQNWYARTIRQVIGSKPFRGKKAVICLPARDMLIQHLRVAKMDDEQMKKALPWEAQAKVPFDIHKALFRHIVAGDVYDGQDTKCEVILMAAARQTVQKYLKTTERAKIEIDHVNVEPFAYINCFGHLLGPQEGQATAVMFIDLGQACCKVVVSHERNIVFARTIPMIHNNATTETASGISPDLGRMAVRQAVKGPAGASAMVLAECEEASDQPAAACESHIDELVEQIRSCVRYHDLMFNAQPIRRVIFLGGMSKKREFCQRLAQGIGLAAQLGDPLARITPSSRTGSHSDLQAGQAYPEWAVAFGLSLGGMKISGNEE